MSNIKVLDEKLNIDDVNSRRLVKRCDVCNGDYRVQKWNKTDINLCSKHTHHMDRYGHILTITKKDKNDIILHETYAEIVLRDIYGEIVGKAKIDLDDIELVSKYKWHKVTHKKCDYAVCILTHKQVDGSYKSKSIRLHRLIMGVLDDKSIVVDHINTFDKMDNRKSNLRKLTSQSENNANKKMQSNNTSGLVGVRQSKNGKWQAYLKYKHEYKLNKIFNTKEEAIYARELCEIYYFRENGLNFKVLSKKYENIFNDIIVNGVDKYIYKEGTISERIF